MDKKNLGWIVAGILLLVIIGISLIPKYNKIVLQKGYDMALNDYADNKLAPLKITQNNETSIFPISICSQEFQENYQLICGI